MTTHTLHFHTHTVHYRLFGTGSAWLIAWHGFADQAILFESLEPSLGTSYRMLAIDMPYHGQTQWTGNFTPKLLHELLELLCNIHSINTFSLLGHSMGGRVIQALLPYYTNDDRVQDVYLLAPAGLRKQWIYNKFWLRPALRWQLRLLIARPQWLISILARLRKYRYLEETSYRFITDNIKRAHRRVRLFRTWVSLWYFPIEPTQFVTQLQAVTGRVVFIYGKWDKITPSTQNNYYRKHLKHAEYYEVRDGHFLVRPRLNSLFTKILK